MKESSRYYVVGLWRVWDRGSSDRDPYHRAPDALLERLGGTFTAEPDDDSVSDAIANAEREISRTRGCERFERVASIVVGDLGWEAMHERSVWSGSDDACRHTASPCNVALHIYGIEPSSLETTRGIVWEPARESARSFDAVVARLRRFGDDMGLPPVEVGPEIPATRDDP